MTILNHRLLFCVLALSLGAACAKKQSDESGTNNAADAKVKKWKDPATGKSYPYCSDEAEDVEDGFGKDKGKTCVTAAKANGDDAGGDDTKAAADDGAAADASTVADKAKTGKDAAPAEDDKAAAGGGTAPDTSKKSFAISCANGSMLNGNYKNNADMCQALSGMQNVCDEAAAFYQGNCAGDTEAAAPSGGTAASGTGTARSYNVNCANGSNYNGSFSTNAAMCSALKSKIPMCPAEGNAEYKRVCS